MKINPLLLPIVMVIALGLAWQFRANLFEDKGRLVIRKPLNMPDAVVFSWHHEIDLPMAKRLYDAYAEWKGKVQTVIIDLNSPGGSLVEGEAVIGVISDMKATHKVITLVRKDNNCLSMCVPLFLQGEQRIAAPSSHWMFHEPISIDFFTGKEVQEPEFERRRTARRFFDRYFTNSEMDPTWRARLEKDWKGKEVWRTGGQLVDEKSNIIHQLLKPSSAGPI